jgi:NHL repeat
MSAMSGECVIVALAGRRYAVERNWGRLPAGIAPAMVSQVAVDGEDRAHVFRRGIPPVAVFTSDGSFAFGYGEGRIGDSHGIYIDQNDRVFLADRDSHEVVVCTTHGTELMRLGERCVPRWELPFSHPTDAAVAADGDIYVSDGYGNARIHRFASDGRYLGGWGRVGILPGEFMTPHAVWVDRQDRVLVADRENDRIQLFNRDGGFIAEWRGLSRPMDIYEDPELGVIYVSDMIPSLTAFAPDGTRLGRCRPSLNGAHGIFGDSAGNIFLTEIQPSCVTRMRRL